GRPEEGPGDPAREHQAAVRRVDLPGRPLGARARRGPPPEPRLRDRPPELRDERVVHQPGARAARALAAPRPLREEGLRAAEGARRGGGPTPPRSARRAAYGA